MKMAGEEGTPLTGINLHRILKWNWRNYKQWL